MNRRQFCHSALQLGLFSAASSLLPWKAWAAPTATASRPQFFILARLFGGWDTSLSMDPWTEAQRPEEKDFFIEYRPEDLLPFQNRFVGPAMLPLKNYFDRLAIVNGLFMAANDGGHDSAALYAESGNGQGGLGVLSLELEGRAFQSPFGTLANGFAYAGNENKIIWDLGALQAAGELNGSDMLLDMGDQNTDLAQARRAIIGNGSKIDLFNQTLKEYKDKIEASFIATAFRSGLSSSAFLNLFAGNLDTHSQHPKNHLVELTKMMDSVKALLDTLQNSPSVDAAGNRDESSTLLDQTTVMLVSEFTRTPALNASQGKDHNPQCNSALVMGPHIRPGMYGGSRLVTRAQTPSGTPYLAGLPLDIVTHQPVNQRKDSFILRPDNLVATVATSMGVDPAKMSQNLGSASVLKNMLR